MSRMCAVGGCCCRGASQYIPLSEMNPASSPLGEMMELPQSFDRFPDHRKIAENILKLLRQDERVLGVYLSGSFAHGKPDQYSDLDFYILVAMENRDRIKKNHAKLRANVGELLSDFPATHMSDPNQIIALYKAKYPVHVDYQYRTPEELIPRKKDCDVLVFWDRSGALKAWKKKCVEVRETYAPTQESLQYLEDRFWTWCIYADSKIRRGELWEARDMIEYLRNNVIVRLLTYSERLPFEGNRRIENKFSVETVSALQSTLQKGHSPKGYSKALLELASLYVQLIDRSTKKFRIKIRRKNTESVSKILATRRL
jgi:predicted nucleotidyltransferase